MKKILSAIIIAIFTLTSNFVTVEAKDVSVKWYYKKNGTYVKPYKRTKKDKSVTNNYSYKWNKNPYTGKKWTKTYKKSYKKRNYKRKYR